jgi:hypothetical protein
MSKEKVVKLCGQPEFMTFSLVKSIECEFVDDDGSKIPMSANFSNNKLDKIVMQITHGYENDIEVAINHLHNNLLKNNTLTTPKTTIVRPNDVIIQYEVFNNQIIVYSMYSINNNNYGVLSLIFCTPEACNKDISSIKE